MHAELGENCEVADGVQLGLKYRPDCGKTIVGDRATIRSGTIIYADVEIGDGFTTGHAALVREKTVMGNGVLVGTNVVVEGHVTVGNHVKMESNVFVPTHTSIGNDVFLGPNAVLTNDKYPLRLRNEYEPEGPDLRDSVTIGANATLLPGVVVGEGSIVGAGSTVTKDVPPWSLAVGTPAKIEEMPEGLKEPNEGH